MDAPRTTVKTVSGETVAVIPHGGLTEALAAFQAELPTITKKQVAQVRSDKGNYSFDYADLSDVSTVVLPILARHGLAWTVRLKQWKDTDRLVLVGKLAHVSGDYVTSVWPITWGTPQQVGSQITYGRRYLLCAMVGVAPEGEDDDGQAAETAVLKRQAREDRNRAANRQARAEAASAEKDWPAILRQGLALTDKAAVQKLWTDEKVATAPEVTKRAFLDHMGRIRRGEVTAEPATDEPEGAMFPGAQQNPEPEP